MPSLHQLLAAHGPLLVLDAASAVIQVGLVRAPGDVGLWRTSEEEAGIGVFRCLEQLGVRPEAAGAHVFCDGPGSILGIRTVAMALRTWQVVQPRPMYCYTSLALLAQAHADGPDGAELGIIADARRDSWHLYQLGRGLRRVPAAELTGRLAMPEHFRHWSPLPAGVRRVPYSVPDLLPAAAEADLFLATDAPDAFLHEEPSYVTWTPQIHRAP